MIQTELSLLRDHGKFAMLIRDWAGNYDLVEAIFDFYSQKITTTSGELVYPCNVVKYIEIE